MSGSWRGRCPRRRRLADLDCEVGRDRRRARRPCARGRRGAPVGRRSRTSGPHDISVIGGIDSAPGGHHLVLVRRAGPLRPRRTCHDLSQRRPSGPRAPRRATAHGTFVDGSRLPSDREDAAPVLGLDADTARRPRQQHGDAAAGRRLHGVAEQFAEAEQDGLGGVLVPPRGRGGPGGVASQRNDREVQGERQLDAALLVDLAALLGATAADRDRRRHGGSGDQDGDKAVRVEEHIVTGFAPSVCTSGTTRRSCRPVARASLAPRERCAAAQEPGSGTVRGPASAGLGRSSG